MQDKNETSNTCKRCSRTCGRQRAGTRRTRGAQPAPSPRGMRGRT